MRWLTWRLLLRERAKNRVLRARLEVARAEAEALGHLVENLRRATLASTAGWVNIAAQLGAPPEDKRDAGG